MGSFAAKRDPPAIRRPGGKDIVRYETSTGARRVLVPAASLVSAPDAKPFEIEDYAWSKDGTRLLLFTNAQKVCVRSFGTLSGCPSL